MSSRSSSKICGALASSYPSPHVSVRYCVFDHCRSFAAVTALKADATVK